MDIKMKIGLRIKELRAIKNLSQNDLGFCIGMDRSYLASIESGKRNVSIVNIEKIATALEVTVKEFFENKLFEEKKEIK